MLTGRAVECPFILSQTIHSSHEFSTCKRAIVYRCNSLSLNPTTKGLCAWCQRAVVAGTRGARVSASRQLEGTKPRTYSPAPARRLAPPQTFATPVQFTQILVDAAAPGKFHCCCDPSQESEPQHFAASSLPSAYVIVIIIVIAIGRKRPW